MKIGFLRFAPILLSFTTAWAAAPNFVIFLADDAGWGDYSSSGNTQVATPHIDSIAKSGVALDRFYVSPVCSPTRAEFLTGRYHPRTGVWGVSTGQERLNLDENTVAEAFRAAGYATGAFGKWHNGSQWPYHPMARGFQTYFGHTSGHWGEYFDASLEDEGRMVRTNGYIVDVCTEKALAFIERNKDRPFFCYIPFTTPHSPWAVPDEDWIRFKNRRISQTATLPNQEVENETRCALAMMENQDRNVGRVLNKLQELSIDENTIVLYFSDNGPNAHRWNGGMKGKKAQTDEGGVRSICYLKWPTSLPAGHVVPEIAAAIDLLPTLTSLAGITRMGDRPIDGIDLSPLLRRDKVNWPNRLIFSTWDGNISVRTQTHRLDHQGRLFDMIKDPGQTTPINQTMPALAAELSGAVETWRKEMFGPAAIVSTRSASNRNQIDPRPIPVGYREFPITMLAARDGDPRGGVARSSRSPNSSYFVNWTDTADSLVWNLEVATRGRYEVAIDYTCPVRDAGSIVELSFGSARLSGKVSPAWDPPLYTNQDTLPRSSAQSRMKEFRTLVLGELELAAGKGALILRATDIPGKSVMDLRRITLTLK
jgi:arylsulfatase A-like enzyme